MVRDSLDKTVVKSRKQNRAAEKPSQSEAPEDPADLKLSLDHEEPTEQQLDLLQWHKLRVDEDPDAWQQLVSAADSDTFPSHLRPFSSPAEYELVKTTYQQLQHSGYYWGPMTMEEAHDKLTHSSQGTFLIRDSGQPDVFFTLSYQSEDGPTSVRIQLHDLLFSLHGSHRRFHSLFALLSYYTGSSCKLTAPYRRQRPESLKQSCRRALIRTYGAENLGTSSALSLQLRDYVHSYPHCI